MPPFKESSFTQNTEDSIVKKIDPKDPFMILGIMFLVISIFTSGISYGYNYYLQTNNNKARDEINAINDSLAKYPLQQMLSYYSRIKTIESIVKEKSHLTTIFYVIESTTQKNIYFRSFNILKPDTIIDKNNKDFTINLIGVSPDYSSIVRQIDSMKEDKYSKVFKSVEFKKVEQSGGGSLVFHVDIKVDPKIAINELLASIIAEENKRNTDNTISQNSTTEITPDNTNN